MRTDGSDEFTCTRELTVSERRGNCQPMLDLERLPEEFPLHTEAAGTAAPDAFGPFRVLHQVGAGTLGPVFRAFDPEHDRLVAVKLFKLDLPPERVHQLIAAFEKLIA